MPTFTLASFKDSLGGIIKQAFINLSGGTHLPALCPTDETGAPFNTGNRLPVSLPYSDSSPLPVKPPAPGLTKRMLTVTLPPFATGGAFVIDFGAGAGPVNSSAAPNSAVTILSPEPLRRNVRVMNTGTGDVTYGYLSTVQPGAGWNIGAAPAPGGQGGSDDDPSPHVGSYFFCSATGTTVTIIEEHD